MFLFWQVFNLWINCFPKFSWVRDFTTKNQEFVLNWRFSLYTMQKNHSATKLGLRISEK
jgi:hypothetical protein